jgi:uncharacterized membrane protein YhhN
MSWLQPEPWGFAVAISALLAIWGKKPARLVLHWIFKPLTTLLILAAVLVLPSAGGGALRSLVAVALVFSLTGDVLLMLPRRVFVAGLCAFLVAQLTYVAAFGSQLTWRPFLLLYVFPVAALAAGVSRFLWPYLGRLKVATTFYVAAIALMALSAICRLHGAEVSAASAAWGVAGGLLFLIADTLLASRRFAARAVPYVVELGTYYAAQWCLASTVWS